MRLHGEQVPARRSGRRVRGRARGGLRLACVRARRASTSTCLRTAARRTPGTRSSRPRSILVFALREALSELAEEGGWRARQRRYCELSGRLRSGLRALGVELLLESEAASASSLTAFRLPPGLDFLTLHDGLVRAGFVIYPGQQHLGDRIFRLAVMGSIEVADIERFLEAFAQLRGATGQRTAGSQSLG